MKAVIRALNERGIERFRSWLQEKATGELPLELLSDLQTTDPVPGAGEIEQLAFDSRYDLAIHVLDALDGCDFGRIGANEGLWAWLSLFYFNLICPADITGTRKVRAMEAYLLDPAFRKSSSHLIREAVLSVRAHGNFAKVLLISPKGGIKDTRIQSELSGRQDLISNPSVIELAWRFYYDERRESIRRGSASTVGGGNVLRFAKVLQQLSVNFDLPAMDATQIAGLLPAEFDTWKAHARFDDDTESSALQANSTSRSQRQDAAGSKRAAVAFADIGVGTLWEREQLATRWGYKTFHALARGVFTPAGDNKIILFVTAVQQPVLAQYSNRLEGAALHWEGERNHANDTRIGQSADRGEEIHIFFREQHHAPFRYLGKAKVKTFELFADKPSKFEFELESVTPEIVAGGCGPGS